MSITTIEQFFARTNWAELRKQKQALVEASAKADNDVFEGLLAFIDGIQDLAQDHYGCEAFPKIAIEEDEKR